MVQVPIFALTYLLLHATVEAAMENEVYTAGCGFEAVPGQLQALKFCTAYGLCIKMLCGPDRVFSRSHCGCVKAVFLSMQTPQPEHNGFDSRISAMRVWSQNLKDAEDGNRLSVSSASGCILAVQSQVPIGTTRGNKSTNDLAMNEHSSPQVSNRANDNWSIRTNGNSIMSGQPIETIHPSRGGTSLHLTTPTNTSQMSENNSKTSKVMENNSSLENTSYSSGIRHDLPETFPENSAAVDVIHGKENDKIQLQLADTFGIYVRTKPESSNTPQAPLVSKIIMSTTPSPSLLIQRILHSRNTTPSQFNTRPLPSGFRLQGQFFPRAEFIVPTTVLPQTLQESWIKNAAKQVSRGAASTNQAELECGAEINITGMSPNNRLTGDGALRLDYIGVRGVTSRNGSAHFNGNSYIWIPFYETRSGITIIMRFQENVSFNMRQGLVANCGNDATSSFSITFDPASRRVKFKAVVISTKAMYPLHEVVEVSIPYTPGVLKTLEMQCNGQRLIAKVDGHVAGSQIPSSELYELPSTARPILVGTGCREDETENFHGEISRFTLYRCVNTGD